MLSNTEWNTKTGDGSTWSRPQPGGDMVSRRWRPLEIGLVVLATWWLVSQSNLEQPPGAVASGPRAETRIVLVPQPATVIVNDTVRLDIGIEDVADLWAGDVRLSFDPTLLQVEDARPGGLVEIQPGTFPQPDWIVVNQADNTAGTIWYAVSQRNPTLPQDGSGVMASIVFKALSPGISPIRFTYQKLVTRTGEQIPVQPIDGEVHARESSGDYLIYLPLVVR
jgi:hypothetical protein